MRISLLQQREPFGEILCRTLERFLPAYVGNRHTVRWYPHRPLLRRVSGKKNADGVNDPQRWLCNGLLNAIFLPPPSRMDLEPVLREFSRSISVWRRLLQRTYVRLATHRHGALLAADAYLEVSPPLREAEHWLIVGGNHKVRVLDRPTDRAVAVLKDGFDPRRFETEIAMRRLAEDAGLPVPPTLAVAEDGSWIEERYVTGTPLNRLRDPVEAADAVLGIGRSLGRFSLVHREEPSVAEYTAPLLESCRRDVIATQLLDRGQRRIIRQCLDTVERRLAEHGQQPFSTGLSHGDLQPGNILKCDERLWLIDWEFAGQRQSGYDGLVFVLQVRHPSGLAARLREFVARPVEDPLLREWPGVRWKERSDRMLSALVLVLEELGLALEESTNRQLFALSSSTWTLVEEIARWLDAALKDPG